MIVEICHNDFILVVYGHKMWTFRDMRERKRVQGRGREEEGMVNHKWRRKIYFCLCWGTPC